MLSTVSILTVCAIIMAILIDSANYEAIFTFTAQYNSTLNVVMSTKDTLSFNSNIRDLEEDALDQAWLTLTDFKNYDKWNTFTNVVQTEYPPKIGSNVVLKVSMGLPWPLNTFDNVTTIPLTLSSFKLITFDSLMKKLCWGIRNGNVNGEGQTLISEILDSLLMSKRCMELSIKSSSVVNDNVEVKLLLKQYDINEGWLAPVVAPMFQNVIEDGFKRMSSDLGRRLLSSSGMSHGNKPH